MRRAGLGGYLDRLDARRNWFATLSPGEQQRLHFARVFLQRPDWVFLDESTSALDESAESDLYGTLRRLCPGTTVVSVGHRSSLAALHDTRWPIAAADGDASRDAQCTGAGTRGERSQSTPVDTGGGGCRVVVHAD